MGNGGRAAGRWAKFRTLSARDRVLLASAAVILPLLSVALRLGSVQRVYRLINVLPRKPPISWDADRIAEGTRIARLVEVAARHTLGLPTCLPRSVALWFFLRRAGIEGRLCIGVRKHGVQLEAHAWVEHQGRVLNDTSDVGQRFRAFEPPLLPFRTFGR